ncbi:MAG TPA: alpha/beta hydrolase [Pseudonocardiaceae bacterium]|nr:alpha/beta hydrolase [Pseudonocardiaceae bacterium]
MSVGSWRDDVIGDSGVRLAVRVAGPLDGPPVVLLHGWAQSARAWTRQLDGPLSRRYRLVAADLRGHGDSEAPADGYDSAAAWAADVRALLAYAGSPVVLVGWSYGGLVITDYLRRDGTEGVAGIVLVGAITEIGRGRPGGRVGPVMRAALPAALSDDPSVSVPALRAFCTDMAKLDDTEWLLEAALRVPAHVRAALFARDVGSADVLAAIDVPTLVIHGRRDGVVDPSAAEYAAGLVPGAGLTWLDTGHLPFAEDVAAFDSALAAHVDECFGLAA